MVNRSFGNDQHLQNTNACRQTGNLKDRCQLQFLTGDIICFRKVAGARGDVEVSKEMSASFNRLHSLGSQVSTWVGSCFGCKTLTQTCYV